MAQTYSQSITGTHSTSRYNAPQTVQIGDTDFAGNTLIKSNPNFIGAFQGVCQRGNLILCKNPDGSQSYHVIDAERSIFPNNIIVRKM
jgi:hypothetical protein